MTTMVWFYPTELPTTGLVEQDDKGDRNWVKENCELFFGFVAKNNTAKKYLLSLLSLLSKHLVYANSLSFYFIFRCPIPLYCTSRGFPHLSARGWWMYPEKHPDC